MLETVKVTLQILFFAVFMRNFSILIPVDSKIHLFFNPVFFVNVFKTSIDQAILVRVSLCFFVSMSFFLYREVKVIKRTNIERWMTRNKEKFIST